MFNQFWEKEKFFISLSTLAATLSALFLNIPTPQIENAKIALGNIQVFWLVLLTIGLAKLFFSFTALLIKTEKKWGKKYDLPVIGAFSATLAVAFLLVISNFWSYILSLYGNSVSGFMSMVFPGLVLMFFLLPLIFLEKSRGKFTRFFDIIIFSFMFSLTISALGIYIQEKILGYFYFYWLFLILPVLFFLFVASLMIISYFKKKPLFEVLSPEIHTDN